MPAHVKRAPAVPEGATHFTLSRHFKDDSGRERRQKVKSEPDEQGIVHDHFAASSFSLPNILATFGGGRYRVDFYDAQGTHVEGAGTVFEVASPTKPAKAKKRARAVEDDPDGEGSEREGEDGVDPRGRTMDLRRRASRGEPIGILDLLAWQDMAAQRAEAIAERRAQDQRAEFQAQQQRDREFMQSMIAMMQQGRGAGVDGELLRRELALGQKETTLALRQEMRARMAEIAAAEPEDDAEDDPEGDDPPASMEEAVERVGGAILSDLEKRAPHLIAKVFESLQTHGWKPGPKVQEAMAAAGFVPGAVNGAAGAVGR